MAIKDNLTTPAGLTTDETSTGNGFMDKVASQLLGQSGIISSTSSNLESKVQSAIKGVKTATEKGNQGIQSEFERESMGLLEDADNAQVEGRAAGNGGLVNLAALRELTGTTDKSLKDLAQRKQELILANDAAGAQKIADLELKAIEYNQKAQQDVFSNILQLGQYGIQAQAAKRAEEAATLAKTEALGELITANPQAGITIDDTIESAYGKIGKNPNSPEVQLKKAQLAKIYNDIKVDNIMANKPSGGGSNLTEGERKSQAISQYSSAFVQGAKMADGTPIIDQGGYVTPVAWRAALRDAPSKNVSRSDFIKEFGYLLYNDSKNGIDAAKYGLTPQELKLVNGSE